MAAVAIKGREETIQVIIQEHAQFQTVISELREKLETMKKVSQDHPWEAFFRIPASFTEEELYAIFQLVESNQGVIAGTLIEEQGAFYDILEQDIHSGDHLILQKPTIIFGNLHPDSFVRSAYDIFVMGKVEGTVQLESPNTAIYAMAYERANLQLFDEIRPNVTVLFPQKFYHKDE